MRGTNVRALIIVVACGLLSLLGPPNLPASERDEPPLFEGLSLIGYDFSEERAQSQALLVHAARGYAGRKRWVFLQTALIPTVELEHVTVEKVHADGTVERVQAPAAVMDWSSKDITTLFGDSLFTAP